MGKIVVSTNTSLDGVVQDPDGQEGFTRGGWFSRFGGTDLEPWARILCEEALGADALLLGRRSDEWFAARWLDRSGEWADRLNGLPKFVVSGTLEQPRWGHGRVLDGDVIGEVRRLKAELHGEIVVYASYELLPTLFEHNLVDQLRLFVFPVVVGGGRRLFGETGEHKPMRLVTNSTIGDGLTHVIYDLNQVADPVTRN